MPQVQRLATGPEAATVPRGGPETDPKFNAFKADVKGKQQAMGKHPPPESEARASQAAAKPPQDDKEAQGKTAEATRKAGGTVNNATVIADEADIVSKERSLVPLLTRLFELAGIGADDEIVDLAMPNGTTSRCVRRGTAFIPIVHRTAPSWPLRILDVMVEVLAVDHPIHHERAPDLLDQIAQRLSRPADSEEYNLADLFFRRYPKLRVSGG